MWWIWLILSIAFTITEAATVSVVSVWFALGSLAAMITSFITDALWLQLLVFALVSGIMLIIAQRFFVKKLKRAPVPTNVDLLIGKTATVSNGRAEIDGLTWAFQEQNEQSLSDGDKVEVLSIEGVKLIVKKL